MEQKIQAFINTTKGKYGLENYYLDDYSFRRSADIMGNTNYTLSMEWLPNNVTNLEDDDLNPDGTASIEIDLNNGNLKRLIFVGEQSFANKITFSTTTTDNIIQWVEHETGLTYGEQFQLTKEEEGRLSFKECFNGVPVAPTGYIEVKYNQEGYLTFFSAIGQFPAKAKFKEEEYTLSLIKVETIQREQLKLFEFSSDKLKQLLPLHVIEEIFIVNDGTTTLPYDFFVEEDKLQLAVDEVIHWDSPIEHSFERKVLTFSEDVTEEQALACEPHPDLSPISELEKEQCQVAVTNFLRQEYPNDTGQWTLTTLHRKNKYIIATLRVNEVSNFIFKRKLAIKIDEEALQAINGFDSEIMLKKFEQYKKPEKVTITKEQAYEKLKEHFILKPVYVYDKMRAQFVLCGKLDCAYAVNAVNGEVIRLDDL